MSRRITLTSVLVMLIIAGLIAGFFAGSIQKALSVSNVQSMMHLVPAAPQPATRSGAKKPAPAVAPVQGGVTTLARDTFQRQNQQFWGTASDGRTWEGDANKVNSFSIANGVGRIANAQGALNALLGLPGTNMEVMLSGSLNRFNNGQVNLGAVLRWSDTNNWYKVLIDGTHISMLKRVNGVGSTLATMPFQAQNGMMYSLRFRAIGAMLFARVWPAGSPEPQNWMLNVTDTALTTGQAGVRILEQNGTIANIASFSVLPAAIGNTA